MKVNQVQKELRSVSHPRDRRVRQLEKKEKRLLKMQSKKQAQQDERIKRSMRFLWFRSQCLALGYATDPVPRETIQLLTQLYISRHQEELQEIKNRSNPPAGRIKEIEALYAQEMAMFHTGGLEVPAMSSSDDVEILTTIWDGIPETSSVLETELVKDPGNLRNEKLCALKEKLATLDAVREQAGAVLPRRFSKKTERNLKKSVKHMEKADDIRKRGASKLLKKQKERSKKESKSALAEMRQVFLFLIARISNVNNRCSFCIHFTVYAISFFSPCLASKNLKTKTDESGV
eukprot:gene6656-4772_t